MSSHPHHISVTETTRSVLLGITCDKNTIAVASEVLCDITDITALI